MTASEWEKAPDPESLGSWRRRQQAIIADLRAAERRIDGVEIAFDPDNARMSAILDTIGGTVEGYPTQSINYLQRLRELVRAEAELAVYREAKDSAYKERDSLVACLSKLWPSHLCRHPDEDTEWEKDWRWIVCVHSPEGQLTWHIHDSELAAFGHLSESENHWDGHNTEEKYKRIAAVRALREKVK